MIETIKNGYSIWNAIISLKISFMSLEE